ncbi:Rho1 guanine nucleotide exchange factor 1 [Nosema granulosis]|uniref:Rho1 guanine nucleotide exchange factor 1 n=1 Tax=Nosema granulosis TaxID=83296 RepID=A0A9P6GXB6_9MICR|nr:Rho1 guanine nucleotide exchange factor 1 [Nosema granulosis]
MSNSRKRIEALNELYMSEKAYIEDMDLWERGFRRTIISFSFLSIKIKYEICDLVFINMHDIKTLHEDIFKDMKERNLEIRKMMDPDFVEDPNDDSFILDREQHENEHMQKLEYATVYFKHASRFKVYEEYVRRLPRAEFELEKIAHYSEDFRKGLQKFMSENGIEFLGARHFLYRPSQKLARYPLLLKAVQKNTEIVTYEKYYADLIEEMKYITKGVDTVFSKYSTQFKIYRLDQQLVYRDGVKNQLCLGLFQKKRKLLKEGEVLVKTESLFEPNVIKIYIFDHVVLLCDIPQGEFQNHYILDDPLFLSKLVLFKSNLGFYPEDDTLTSLHPLYILETSNNKVRSLYFDDEVTRDIYYKIIRKAIRKIRAKFDLNIRIEKLNINLSNDINNACKSSREVLDSEEEDGTIFNSESDKTCSSVYSESSSIEEDTKDFYDDREIRVAISEYTNAQIESNTGSNRWRSHLNTLGFVSESQREEREEEGGTLQKQETWVSRICYSNDFFNRSVKFEMSEDTEDLEFIRKQDEMVLTSSTEGIMKILDGEKTLIYDESVNKVLYDSKYEVIIFQSGSTLYIAHFNCKMESFEKTALKNDIGDFFYGTTKRGSYIASRNFGGGKSSLIYLFLIEKNERTVTIDLSRKLYVGFKVYNIIFSREKIVIACKDFEVVDMDTLRTEELLETYDPFINIFFRAIPHSKARAVFPITSDTYLLCFDSLGFIVDLLGRIKTTDRIFLWNCLPVDFKVFYNYVICVGKKCIDVYNLDTGDLIYTYLQNGLKFVKGTQEPFLHDTNDFYALFM